MLLLRQTVSAVVVLSVVLSSSCQDSSRETSKKELCACVSKTKCTVLLEYIGADRRTKADLHYLENSTCGFEGSLPRLCCPITVGGSYLRIRERAEWHAQPPQGKTALESPVPFVIIAHSRSKSCDTTDDCIFMVRTIQQLHMESRFWFDIAYNFLVGGDGVVYEGRGWDVEGSHTSGWNSKSIGICVIGNFTTVEPTPEQLFSAQKLIARGVALGKISTNYKLLAHNQTQSTESPGRLMYNVIKNWPHWYNAPIV